MLDVLVSILGFFPVVGLAALGGLIGQKAGVWNMAIEGMMTFGPLQVFLLTGIWGGPSGLACFLDYWLG